MITLIKRRNDRYLIYSLQSTHPSTFHSISGKIIVMHTIPLQHCHRISARPGAVPESLPCAKAGWLFTVQQKSFKLKSEPKPYERKWVPWLLMGEKRLWKVKITISTQWFLFVLSLNVGRSSRASSSLAGLAVLFYGSLQCNKLRKRLSYHCRGSFPRFADIKGPTELY